VNLQSEIAISLFKALDTHSRDRILNVKKGVSGGEEMPKWPAAQADALSNTTPWVR
jgi:hypothetical protein